MEFLGTFWRSFWSPLAYKNALSWKWKIFFYFILLSLFSSLIMAYPLYKTIKEVFDVDIPHSIKDMTPFEIVDGKVKTPEDKLYTYDLPDGRGFLAVSEKPATLSKDYLVSVEQDKLIMFGLIDKSIALKDLTDNKNMTIDKARADKILDFAYPIICLGIVPSIFLTGIVSNLLFLLILSIFTLTRSMTSPLKLGYIGGLKISVLAITPMVILQSVGTWFSLEDSAGFIYGLISIALVWYVIKKLPEYYDENPSDDENTKDKNDVIDIK